MKNFTYTINGVKYHVQVLSIEGESAEVRVNGTTYEVELERPQKDKPLVRAVSRTPKSVQAKASTPTGTVAASPGPVKLMQPAGSDGASPLQSPLPGVILKIEAKEGDTVKRGQRIMILEAMKMENDIKAHKDGVISSIDVQPGDNIQEGTTLATIS